MMVRQTITVDIAPGNGPVPRLKVSQGDEGRPLGVYVIQNGAPLDVSQMTVELYILKPDGNYYIVPAAVDANETNLVVWVTQIQETPISGDCEAQIRISQNSTNVGTARFVEYVEAAPGSEGIDSESKVDTLQEYVRRCYDYQTECNNSEELAGRHATYANLYRQQAEQAETRTRLHEDGAAEYRLQAQAWATGKRGNADVGEYNEAYHNNSKYYSELASASESSASASAETALEVLASIPQDYSRMNNLQLLLAEVVPDTVQQIVYDGSGNITSITHKRNGSAIRTDSFVFGTTTITETRVLSSGASLSIVTDMDTLDTTTTYSAA